MNDEIMNVIVYTYYSKVKASEVLKTIVEMKQKHLQKPLINVEDAAVVIKNKKGKVKGRQTLESAAKRPLKTNPVKVENGKLVV